MIGCGLTLHPKGILSGTDLRFRIKEKIVEVHDCAWLKSSEVRPELFMPFVDLNVRIRLNRHKDTLILCHPQI